MEYRYKELFNNAINNPTKENLERLYNWFKMYANPKDWGGESWRCGDGYYLKPIYQEVDEDVLEAVNFELVKG